MARKTGLEWYLTSIIYPLDSPRPVPYGRLTNPQEGRVTVPLNDARTASVKVSVYDPIVQNVEPYSTMLKAYYRDHLVFWGPIPQPEWDAKDGTVTLAAVDQSLRLQHHYVRRGDAAIDLRNGYDGRVPVDGNGLRMLRDAGNNTPNQDVAGWPPLGVIDGWDSSNIVGQPTGGNTLRFERGHEVWSAMKDVCSTLIGPDMDLVPIDDTDLAYARLDVYDRLGYDKHEQIAFHMGFGNDMLENLIWRPGGKFISHAHVLSADGRSRITAVDAISAEIYGIYVEWDATDFAADAALLREYGEARLNAYGRPPDFFEITLRHDLSLGYHFIEDYYIGDTVTASVRKGHMQKTIWGRIMEVTLEQIDPHGTVRPSLRIVPHAGAEE